MEKEKKAISKSILKLGKKKEGKKKSYCYNCGKECYKFISVGSELFHCCSEECKEAIIELWKVKK